MKSRPVLIFAMVWVIAFCVALLVDASVARWVHDSGLGVLFEGKWWAQIFKEPGQFRFTLFVTIALVLTKQIKLRQVFFVVAASAISGLHVFLKWIVGRTRPYKLPMNISDVVQPRPFELHPFRDRLYGFFHQKDLSFPSGHVCQVSALMMAMFFVWPRHRWIFLSMTVIVAIERVAENAHYCSDCIGAVGFGVVGTLLLYHGSAGWLQPVDRGTLEVG